MEKRCAYCGKVGNLTKEHLFPRCLLSRTEEYTSQFLDAAPSGFIGGELTIRDVCSKCNGGALSALDTYICQLYDAYFDFDVDVDESVTFKYDYHSLTRWLLKTSFNVSRTKREGDASILSEFVPYILSAGAPKQLVVFAQVVPPRVLTRDEEAAIEPEVRDVLPKHKGRCVILPSMLRASCAVTGPAYADILLRMVSINAFYFYLATPRSARMLPRAWQQTRRSIQSSLHGLVQLTANSKVVTLRPSEHDVVSSYVPTVLANRERIFNRYGKDG